MGVKDLEVAFWLKAAVRQADTHVYWKAEAWSRRGSQAVKRMPFFTGYVCSIEMFLDWIKRRVVVDVAQDSDDVRGFQSWDEIQTTLEECQPHAVIPLSEEAEARVRQYRIPDERNVYEIIVDVFRAEQVLFDLTLWGYKYKLSGLSLTEQEFYEFADKLRAQIRLRTDWAGVDEVKGTLQVIAKQSATLIVIRAELQTELRRLDVPTAATYESVCAAILRLIEKLLRNIRNERGWQFKSETLDHLIRGFEGANVFPGEVVQMLHLVSKPYRDYVLHGHPLSFPVAKALLATSLDLLGRIATALDN